jgi:hypothetical protein
LLAHSKFLFAFSNIADMLNCTNRFSKRKFDTPLTEDNYQILKEYADNFISYIESLKCADGKSILKSNKKTGFLGLSLCLKKMFKLFDTLKPHGLTYLLTYKLSQDYLETFFSAIRSREGFNNNPNALQFKSAYKRLLIRHEIKKIENGNCLFDGVEIPHVSTTRKKITRLEGDVLNKSVSDFGHDYISTFWQLSQYVENVVNYIADYISKKKLQKNRLQCLSSADYWKRHASVIKDPGLGNFLQSTVTRCDLYLHIVRKNCKAKFPSPNCQKYESYT